MTPTIAFFPRNSHHIKFFSLVARDLKNNHGITSIFIREIGSIENQQVFEFEKEIEKIWSTLDISIGALESLQNQYPDFNFMRAIYSEREFNFFPFYFGDKQVSHEHQLKYLVGCFKVFDQWVSKVRIDFIVSELITGVADAVLKAVAEKNGINYFSVRPSKMTPGVVVCNKSYDEPMGMRDYYESFVKNGVPEDIKSKALDHITGLRDKIRLPAYMEATQKPHKLITKSKLIALFDRTLREKVPVNSISARRHPLKNPIRWALYKKINVWRTRWARNKLFSKNVSPSDRFFIYPLHYEPESSTLVRAFYFSDQLALIKLIAKVLPLGVMLVVKEHGGNQGYRKPDFYHELSYMPNVIMLPPSHDVSKLLKDCIGVITLTGRMGWEALVNNKCVITLGNTFWTFYESVQRVESWNELSIAITTCCQHEKKSGVLDDIRLLAFAASYIQCTHEGSFVLNTDKLLAPTNVKLFTNILLGLRRTN
ncbi:MAG: capsular biosynthesis protein [Betaproteobacteria bacterium]|nr:capsular biosynthesis protein [Betaproteobacteria bacterium]